MCICLIITIILHTTNNFVNIIFIFPTFYINRRNLNHCIVCTRIISISKIRINTTVCSNIIPICFFGIIILVKIIINSTISFKHQRFNFFNKPSISPITEIECIVFKIHMCGSKTSSIIKIFYTIIRIRFIFVNAIAVTLTSSTTTKFFDSNNVSCFYTGISKSSVYNSSRNIASNIRTSNANIICKSSTDASTTNSTIQFASCNSTGNIRTSDRCTV